MEFKLCLLSLLIIGVLSVVSTSAARLIGGYQPIKNPSDPYVAEIGKFAVSEHNKKTSSKLVFVGVLSGEEQVVAGKNYKLNIKAIGPNTNDPDKYQAVVHDNPSEKSRSLTSFVQLEN